MPTLMRLLSALALIAGTVFAIMAALVHLVVPEPRPVSVEIPLNLAPPPEAPAPALPAAEALAVPVPVVGATTAPETLRP